jgi:N-formylglutamate amidohydrolase
MSIHQDSDVVSEHQSVKELEAKEISCDPALHEKRKVWTLRKTLATLKRNAFASLFSIVFFCNSNAQTLMESSKLVTVQEGTLPVIITAPHGGRLPVPGLLAREGNGIERFATVRDERTDRLASRAAELLEELLGQRPYLVIAQFDRRYLDVNRPASEAFESPEAEPYYQAYHDAVKTACMAVREKWGRGLLLDIHGQSAVELGVYRGSQDGLTVKKLLEQFGWEAYLGSESVCGQLEQKGIPILPSLDKNDKENEEFKGGYIVKTYGSHQGTEIDAIQLEFGIRLRERENIEKTAASLASSIAAFSHKYLPLVKVQITPSER